MVAYDPPGDRCLGGPQSGTVALRRACMQVWNGDLADVGIYACRNVGTTKNKSLHAEGRAWDGRPRTQAIGDAVAHALVDRAAALGVQEVIWWERIWTPGQGWHPYRVPAGGSPHRDHFHVSQNWDGARRVTADYAYAVLRDRDITMQEVTAMKSLRVAKPVPGMGAQRAFVALFTDGSIHAVRCRYEGGPNILRDDLKGLWVDHPDTELFVWGDGDYTVVTGPGAVMDFHQGNREYLDRQL